jgi:hypothetical protein
VKGDFDLARWRARKQKLGDQRLKRDGGWINSSGG